MSKEEKKELVSLLPVNLQKSKEFTANQKLVLGFLIYKNGMDKVEKDGYFFATNESISSELGISVKSIIAITKKFINLNFISRKSGHRNVATEYIVYEDKINSYVNVYPTTEGKGKPNMINVYPNSEGKGKPNDIKKLTKTIELLINKIGELEDEIKSLKVKVNDSYVYPISKVNVNTDTDTESDIEKEKDILYNNINNNILNKRYYLNKEYINNNKIYYKDILLFNNIKEKIENKVTPLRVLNENKPEIELIPIEMKREEETVETRNISKFQVSLNKLFSRMDEIQSMDELDEKVTELCKWVEKHENLDPTIDKELTKELISNKVNEIQSKLKQCDNFFNQILIDNFTTKEEKPKEQQTANKEKVEKDLSSMLDDLKTNGVNDMSLTSLNFYKEKFSKEIEEYDLTQLVKNIEELIQPNKAISDVSKHSSTDNDTTTEETEESAGKELKMTLEESLENAMKGTWTLGDGKILNKADIFVPVVEEYPF